MAETLICPVCAHATDAMHCQNCGCQWEEREIVSTGEHYLAMKPPAQFEPRQPDSLGE